MKLPAGLILVVAGLLVVLLHPLRGVGRRMGPGWDQLLDGAVGMLLLLAGGIWAIVALLRRRRA